MQSHVTSVLKGLVKDSSKYALNELLGSRAAASEISQKLSSRSWNARVGLVLIDDARLRAYTPRAAVEWAIRYETEAGVEETLGGTWFSQASGKTAIEAESYVARTAIVNALDFKKEGGPWTRAPDAALVRMTANETRQMLKLKANGWSSDDFATAIKEIEENCLAEDAISASPFGVDVGPEAIVKSLGAFHLLYEPADIAVQDVVVGTGKDRGLFAARRTVAVANKGSDNFDSDRELVFGEIVKDGKNIPKLRYARSIFDPVSSPRRPDPMPEKFPMASCYSNYAA